MLTDPYTGSISILGWYPLSRPAPNNHWAGGILKVHIPLFAFAVQSLTKEAVDKSIGPDQHSIPNTATERESWHMRTSASNDPRRLFRFTPYFSFFQLRYMNRVLATSLDFVATLLAHVPRQLANTDISAGVPQHLSTVLCQLVSGARAADECFESYLTCKAHTGLSWFGKARRTTCGLVGQRSWFPACCTAPRPDRASNARKPLPISPQAPPNYIALLGLPQNPQ